MHGANKATRAHLRLPLPPHRLGFSSLAGAGAAGGAAAVKGKGRASAPGTRTASPAASGDYGALWAPSGRGATLAAELLGLPPDALGDGFTAKDVDAVYMLDGGDDGFGGLDADLASILEVPDTDFAAALGPGPDAVPQGDGGASTSGAGPSAGGGGRRPRGGGGGGGGGDGVVPDLGPPKRARA